MTDDVYKNELSSSSDRWLFGGAFLVGTAAILVLKVTGAPSWTSVVTGVGVLLAYAAVSWRSVRFRLREDRTGDSVYYLGFLFTLVSLSYALWAFAQPGLSGGVNSVIANFAVALATTIAGLVLRVMFQQMREDPIEFEREARVELSQAVHQLKTELSLGVEDLSAFRTRLKGELQDEFAGAIRTLLEETSTALKEVSAQQRDFVTETSSQLQETLRTAKQQTTESRRASLRLIQSIDRLSERIDQSEPPSDALRDKFVELAAAVSEVIRAERQKQVIQMNLLEPTLKSLTELQESAQQATASMAAHREAVGAMAEAVRASNRAVGAFASDIGEAAKLAKSTLEEQVKRSAELGAITEANNTAVIDANRKMAGLVAQSAEAVTAVNRQMAASAALIVREIGGNRS